MASPTTSGSRPQRWRPAHAPELSSSSSSSSSVSGDLLQLLTLDLSPLEKRFEQVFARLETLERMAAATSRPLSDSDHDDTRVNNSVPPVVAAAAAALADASPPPTSSASAAVAMDASALAKELESLHATQLRLKIEHELAQSAYKVEMETLRRDLLALPQHADLHNFRAEMDVTLSTTIKSLGDQQALLWQDVERTLATRELSENQWKAHFESSLHARIEDVWAGVHASQRTVRESMTALETDMVTVQAATQDATATVDVLQLHVAELDKRVGTQEEAGATQQHATAQLHALVKQTNVTMATQDATLQSAIDAMTSRMDDTQQRHDDEQRAYVAFVSDVEKTLSFCTGEISSGIQPALQAHQDKLLALDMGLATTGAELKSCQDHLLKSDSRLGSLDGRLVQQEKQTATLVQIVQEHHHETTRQVGDTKKSLELALQDRVAIKRAATELSFTVQETQQTLQEVSKMAATTELSLMRTAAEIPKLHVLATTNIANIAKNRQSIGEVSQTLMDEKKFTQQLSHSFEKEVQSSNTRFADFHRRDDTTQQSIATTNTTMQHVKHALEQAIKYNSNMIHQLNAVVDSLAITESATGMDDKLARFAMQTAEVGLKLEHFASSSSGSSSGSGSSAGGGSGVEQGDGIVKADIKAELAVLLAKIVRFLGAGVSIDHNKYFLSASKLAFPAHDPTSGALVVEMAAAHVLEQLRMAKVSVFSAKMRLFMDQLRPVAQTVRSIHESRDHFEKKVRYVLEFGLANLFPNLGRPRNPNRRNPNAGTCIACDRPLDDEHDAYEEQGHCRGFGRLMDVTTDPEVDAVDDQKMRRSKLVTSTTTASAAVAGMTHKIDTRTAVKGRSGGRLPLSSANQQRPRSALSTIDSSISATGGGGGGGGSAIHHAPGTSEYVYRAGFRLPRPSTAGSMGKSASAAELAALTGLVVASAAGAVPQDDGNITKQTLDDTMSSCLEKVALVGRHSASVLAGTAANQTMSTVEIPAPMMTPPSPVATSSSPLVRPHTAPLRSRSLPRLEITAEPSR